MQSIDQTSSRTVYYYRTRFLHNQREINQIYKSFYKSQGNSAQQQVVLCRQLYRKGKEFLFAVQYWSNNGHMFTSLGRNPVREFLIAKGSQTNCGCWLWLQSVNRSLGLHHRGVWNQIVGRWLSPRNETSSTSLWTIGGKVPKPHLHLAVPPKDLKRELCNCLVANKPLNLMTLSF